MSAREELTPERLAEITDLLRYESSIAFYSHRAKESMLLLLADAKERRAESAENLTDTERQFLTFALDLAFDQMVSGDGFTDEDEAALASLRRLAASSPRTTTGGETELEQLREQLAAAQSTAERHRENAYKQGQLAARRLERARRAEAQRDTLEAELAQAIEHRDHWHGELKCADARIAELGAASSSRTAADEQPEAEQLRADLVRVRAERDELYSKADFWRESYRLAKGYTDDELNARVAIDEATRLHRHPCRFPSSPDCTCKGGGQS